MWLLKFPIALSHPHFQLPRSQRNLLGQWLVTHCQCSKGDLWPIHTRPTLWSARRDLRPMLIEVGALMIHNKRHELDLNHPQSLPGEIFDEKFDWKPHLDKQIQELKVCCKSRVSDLLHLSLECHMYDPHWPTWEESFAWLVVQQQLCTVPQTLRLNFQGFLHLIVGPLPKQDGAKPASLSIGWVRRIIESICVLGQFRGRRYCNAQDIKDDFIPRPVGVKSLNHMGYFLFLQVFHAWW